MGKCLRCETLLEAQRHFKVREETMLECCFLPHLKVHEGMSWEKAKNESSLLLHSPLKALV